MVLNPLLAPYATTKPYLYEEVRMGSSHVAYGQHSGVPQHSC